MSRSLVLKLTCGTDTLESLERTAQALTVAATAAASGTPVSLWLTGDATLLATPLYAERLALPHATSFAELRDVLLDLQAVTVCTQCAVRRGLTDSDLLPGAHIAGAASFVEAALAEGAQALSLIHI